MAHEVNCGSGVFFSELLGMWSRFQCGLASYVLVDVYLQMDLGGGNQQETGCGGGQWHVPLLSDPVS
jgi:hypothetical protein